MKKTFLLLLLATTVFIACTKNTIHETNNSVVLAENVQSIVPLIPDSDWDERDWNALYKYDNEKIFNTIIKGVKTGKLKAYSNLSNPQSELSIKEFSNIIVAWDSTAATEDPNKPGTFITAPIKYELTGESLVQLRFHEKIEIDTVSYTLHKTATWVSFIAFKYDEGEVIGLKNLFDVKLENTERKE